MATKLIKKGEHLSPETEFSKNKPSWNKGLKRSGMSGKHHSTETKLKMSLGKRGDKGTNWKGGIAPLNKVMRRSLEYRLWRESVFARDKYTCIWCGARNGNGIEVELHPDHIKPFSLYPELRFAIDNGRTLCAECHKKTETYGGKIRQH